MSQHAKHGDRATGTIGGFPTWVAAVGGVVVLVIAIVVGFRFIEHARQHGVIVNFYLHDASSAAAGCHGPGGGGYSDIGPGTPVVIKNAKGVIIASSTLGDGVRMPDGSCYYVSILTVGSSPQYTAEVGSRGEITASRQQLEADDWQFNLELGQ